MKGLINYWRALTRLTQSICLFTLVNIILVNLVLSEILATKETVLTHTTKFLHASQKSDSWTPMIKAFNYLQSAHQELLYSKIFFDDHIKFQYPPTSLLILSLLEKILPKNNAWNDTSEIILKGSAWLFVIGMLFFVTQIFSLSLEKNFGKEINKSSKLDLISRTILICWLTLSFYPVVKAYSVGQIQTWVNSLFSIAIWCWLKEKKQIAGTIVGIMCLIKPQYVIILIWGALRKQWSFAIAFATTILICLSISILLFGRENHINYLDVLSFISKHGEAYQPNQSINGLLNRLLFNGDNLNFHVDSFPPFNPLVYIGTTISSIALISIALLKPIKNSEKGSIADISIAALTCTIASPVAWEHHYGILLPIYAFLLPCLLKKKIFGDMTIPYFCISYLLCSNYFKVTDKLAYTSWNILQSYLLAGGFMVLVYLYALRDSKVDITNS